MDVSVAFPSQKLNFSAQEEGRGIAQNSKTYVVYQHINSVNGFVYVGITKYYNNPNKRWMGGNAYKGNSKFYNAIKKYGWNKFEHICEYVINHELACIRERELIAYYKKLGISYNIADGGDGAESVSPETREKLKKYTPWIKGKHHSLEAKKKISEAGKGRKMSDENKEKLKIANHIRLHIVSEKARLLTIKRFSKPVYQIDKETDEIIAEFPSATAAELAMRGYRGGHISEICRGRTNRYTCYGFKWRYKE